MIGNGNVAVDVARMLVLDPDEMAVTDTADHAIAPLASASVHEVIVLGRRGPAQAAFTTPELRELGELTRADIIVDPADMELDAFSANWLETEGDPTNKRNVDLMREYAQREPHGHERRVELRFLRSPVEILGEGEDGPVTGVRIVKNQIENGRAVATGEEEVIACGLVIRSIGYRGAPLAGIPFDERRGPDLQPRRARARRTSGEHEVGEYVVGWVKRGPSGVIGTNKKDATDTVARILEDREAGKLNTPKDADPAACEQFLAAAVPGARDVGGLARDRRPRDRPRRAAGPPAREARAHGRDDRHRLRRQGATGYATRCAEAATAAARRGRAAGPRRG